MRFVTESILSKSILQETKPSLSSFVITLYLKTILYHFKLTTGIDKSFLAFGVDFLLGPKAEAVNLLYDKVYDLRLPGRKRSP